MARVNIFDLCKSVSMESDDVSHDTTIPEVDNNKVSVKALMNDELEQAEENDEMENVAVKNDNDGQLASSMEELELQTAEDEVEQGVDDVEESFNDLENTDGAITALEAYRDLLTGMDKKGYEVSRETAQAIRIGLEAFDSEAFADVVVSVEDISGNDNSSKSTLSKIWDKLKKLFALAKKIVIKAMDSALNLWNFVVNNIGKLREKLKEIDTKISKSNGEFDLTVKSISPLLLTSKSDSVDVKELANTLKIAHKVYSDIPTAIHAVSVEVKKELSYYIDSVNKDNPEDISDKVVSDIQLDLNRRFKAIFPDVESKVFLSTEIVGAQKIKVEVADITKVDNFFKSLGLGVSLVNVSMVSLGNKSSSSDSSRIRYSGGEVKQLLSTAGDLIDAIETGMEMRKTAKEVQKQFQGDISAPQKAKINVSTVVEKAGANLMKDAIRANVQLTGHLFRVVKALITLLSAVSDSAVSTEKA